MRKNNRIITLAVAAAVMMAVTACGSKDKTETTVSTEVTTEAVTTTAAPETTAESAETEETEETAEDGESEESEDQVEETTVSQAGETGADGVFKAATGKFEITVPQGWTIDGGSDDEYVTFLSESGDDMLEVTSISGSSADSIREVYPDTAEEYQNMVSRDDGMQILSYDVKTKEDGSQTFQYSMKYDNPSDGIHYLIESGAFDAAKQTYTSVTGTVMSADENVQKQVEEAVKSFKINN